MTVEENIKIASRDICHDNSKIEEIIGNDDYINWLERFREKLLCLDFLPSNDDSKKVLNNLYRYYELQKIGLSYLRQDKENLEKIGLLFYAIERYTKNNYLYPFEKEFNGWWLRYYSIKHNNIGYGFGKMFQRRDRYVFDWVELATITPEDEHNFIDFKMIQDNITTDRAKIIRRKLETLESFIDSLTEEDVPLTAIEDTTANKIRLLKNS